MKQMESDKGRDERWNGERADKVARFKNFKMGLSKNRSQKRNRKWTEQLGMELYSSREDEATWGKQLPWRDDTRGGNMERRQKINWERQESKFLEHLTFIFRPNSVELLPWAYPTDNMTFLPQSGRKKKGKNSKWGFTPYHHLNIWRAGPETECKAIPEWRRGSSKLSRRKETQHQEMVSVTLISTLINGIKRNEIQLHSHTVWRHWY